jgi:hypothetical protein
MNYQFQPFTTPSGDCEDHHLTSDWESCTQCTEWILRLTCCCGDTRSLHTPQGCRA